jgi:D-lactate dehydrogenase (cytochrome)
VTSFEIMSRMGIDAVIEHGPNVRDPLAKPYPWYALIELSSQETEGLRDTMESLLADAIEQGIVLDATIADSLEQAKAFWFIRDFFGEVQRRIGASIKHDVSVPIAAVPAFIEEANAAVVKLIPGARPLPFGHAGDGNIHYNVTQPVGADGKAFLARWDEVNAVVFEVVRKYNGSISAEHGVGVMKRDILPVFKDPVALALMRTLKKTLDPNNVLNPGKVI